MHRTSTLILFTGLEEVEPVIEMANVTISVSEELKKKMGQAKRVNWSEVAREAFEEKLRRQRMHGAAVAMDRLREATRGGGWSSVREIRKWRARNK